MIGHDVVVLMRGSNNANGHVGLYSGQIGPTVYLLGGNQNNTVNVSGFNADRIVSVNRIMSQ